MEQGNNSKSLRKRNDSLLREKHNLKNEDFPSETVERMLQRNENLC